MAQKQIIWSGYAKKTVYSALEAIISGNGGTSYALKFFRTLSKELAAIAKSPGMFRKTSGKDVFAFPFDRYLVLFESRDSGLIIHSVSENRTADNKS